MRRCRRALEISSMLLSSRRQIKERLAKKKLAVQLTGASFKRRRQNCRRSRRERSRRRRRRRTREYVAAHPDGEREKDVEAAGKIAEQEAFRRSVAAHMSGQQGSERAGRT
jgi:hypothetical protein